jgi:DNA-binding transcriptional regulator YhcF (GntR family)
MTRVMRRDINQGNKLPPIYNYIRLNEMSVTPMYIQLAKCIVNAIDSTILEKNEWLPSINEISFTFDIARDTVEKAYRYLKKKGYIGSFPGKGYYLTDIRLEENPRVFLLFNKLSAHKKIIFDSFVNALGSTAHVDFFVYHNDYNLFKKFIYEADPAKYSHYVLIPHFLEGKEFDAHEIINTIPKEKLVLLDKNIPGITGKYAAVFENFEKDIYESLKIAREDLRCYKNLKLLFPQNSYYPLEIITGFTKFCTEFGFDYQIVADIAKQPVGLGDVFLNLAEDDLVPLVEHLSSSNFRIGVDIGILSYNETPIKRIILNGISTISTDFKYMGNKAAELVMSRSNHHIEVPFGYNKRKSM